MSEVATYVCSICSEPSTEICIYCTKDACANHRCERCRRCSDCCECEVRLREPDSPAHVMEPSTNSHTAAAPPFYVQPPTD